MKTIRRADASKPPEKRRKKPVPSLPHHSSYPIIHIPLHFMFRPHPKSPVSEIPVICLEGLSPDRNIRRLGVCGALRRLREFLVGGMGHISR